jgi:hypothetical protein
MKKPGMECKYNLGEMVPLVLMQSEVQCASFHLYLTHYMDRLMSIEQSNVIGLTHTELV